MAKFNSAARNQFSISSKFNQPLLTLFLVLVLALIPIMYYLTKTQVLSQANKELTLLEDMVKSVRNVVHEDTRQHFTPKGEFIPVVASTAEMAKTVVSKFVRIHPDYYITIFSDNPLNADDFPDVLETQLLGRFRQNKQLKPIVDFGTIRGQKYLLSSAPVTVKKDCLLCHGDPAHAPLAISEKYGTESGYGWTVGSIIGGIAIGVPLDNINAIAVKRTLFALLPLALIFGVLYIYINTIVRRSIITPITEIAKKAQKISHGDLGDALVTDRDDEIGELAKSFEMMRHSFISLVREIKANNT